MFSTLTKTSSTPSLDVAVDQLEVDSNHWHSFNYIVNLAEELELLFIKFDRFVEAEKDLINFLLVFNKANPRITELKFFKAPCAQVCVCVSDIPTFKKDHFLQREINIDFKKQKKLFVFNDVTTEEWNSREKKLPISWQFNEGLSNKYNKYKRLFV